MQELLEGYMKNGHIPQNQELLGRVSKKHFSLQGELIYSHGGVWPLPLLLFEKTGHLESQNVYMLFAYLDVMRGGGGGGGWFRTI